MTASRTPACWRTGALQRLPPLAPLVMAARSRPEADIHHGLLSGRLRSMKRRASIVICIGALLAPLCSADQQPMRFTSFDPSVLNQIKDEDLDQVVIEYVQSRLKERSGDQLNIVSGLPRGFLVFYASWLVEAEVMNGGFHQYFWNSSSDFADVTADALTALGDPDAAAMMTRAISVAIAELPTTAKYMKEGTLQAFSESAQRSKLNSLDAEFCAHAAKFAALRIRYVRAHPDQFSVRRGPD